MSESQAPNPFSREASEPSDGLSADPDPGSATPPTYRATGGESPDQYAGDWPSYPAGDPYGRSSVDPYAMPGESYNNLSANSTYAGPKLASRPSRRRRMVTLARAMVIQPVMTATPTRPTRISQPSAQYSPYGAVPEATPTGRHPQAPLALILGIIGTVLGMTCVVGGFVGIGGIVTGTAGSQRDRCIARALYGPLAG